MKQLMQRVAWLATVALMRTALRHLDHHHTETHGLLYFGVALVYALISFVCAAHDVLYLHAAGYRHANVSTHIGANASTHCSCN